jgi:hypothetical protein
MKSTTSATALASLLLSSLLTTSTYAATIQHSLSAENVNADCKVIAGDESFPSLDQLVKEVPSALGKEADNRPDFHLAALTFGDVQKAVQFAYKNKIRLSVLNSGHDYLGRNDAPSGLGLDISKLKGVKIFEEFKPSTEAVSVVDRAGMVNVIQPVEGKQAAVTFGPGVSTQELNTALAKSKLFTVGAGHGVSYSYSPF